MTHLLQLLMNINDNLAKQTRFILQGTRYMNGASKLCQWYLDVDTNKLYKLSLEETTIEEALSLKREKNNEL